MLKLRIENFDRLPDGGPLDYTVDRRGFDFGRDSHLDWTLPDKTRVISGKHCEIRYYDDAYWLVDVSTNGTFVNGSSKRVKSPYQLNEGDKLQIGEYVISVTLDLPPRRVPLLETPEPQYVSEAPPRRANLWDMGGEAPPPIDARELMPKPAPGEVAPDFLHQALFVPPAAAPAEEVEKPKPAMRGTWGDEPPPSAGEPQRPAPVLPTPKAMPADPVAGSDFLQRFAKGAGLPAEALSKSDPGQVAELAGELLSLTCANLMAMLQARAEAKALSKSGSRTLIRATENNPLKFMPTPDEALLAMLQPRGKGYLGAQATIESSFSDLKRHHFALLAAMQAAANELLEELSPLALEKASEKKKSLLGSGKTKMWDDLVKRWSEKAGRRENGALEAFLDLFAEHYDKFSKMQSSN